MIKPASVTVGGIPTSLVTRSQLAAIMVDDCNATRGGERPAPRVVVSSNGSVVAAFNSEPKFKSLMLQADIVDADGMPIVLASRLLCRNGLPERIATTDFIVDAARAAAEHGVRFYFLGGEPGVAAAAADRLSREFPGLQIVGTRHGYFSPDEVKDICADIVAKGTDVLWVGLGSPLQERFAIENRSRLQGVAWIRTCGGLFDHCIQRTKRAPRWIQNAGFEWLFRLIQEPRRLGRRYLMSNPVAAIYLLTKTFDTMADRSSSAS